MVCSSVAYSNAGKISTSKGKGDSQYSMWYIVYNSRRRLTQGKAAPDAFDSTNKPFLELFLDARHLTINALLRSLENDLCVLWPREEIDDISHAILVDVASLQDIGRGQVLLLGGAREIL